MKNTLQKNKANKITSENYFLKFREGVIGINQIFKTPYGEKKIIYADWTASGRLYEPIENLLQNEIYPFVGNTHTETSVTGYSMTMAYHKSLQLIKSSVHAQQDDIIISYGSGMTQCINKFQRILGIRVHEKHKSNILLNEKDRPVVFVTHMEHHSNHTSWLETIAEVVVIEPDKEGLVNLDHFECLLNKYKNRKMKFAAITACSNVTGIITPYYAMAELIHKYNGYCFVDFACAAPYIKIDMHPENNEQRLDAIFFSPHKFLGGPGSAGVLIFNPKLYHNNIPDNPGGGTVKWTNPWGERSYFNEIEVREDGGTPAFLQTIKAAFCMQLKNEMGVENILHREKELLGILWNKLSGINNLNILAANIPERLGVVSFYIDDLHYNLGVKLLNDYFGIQSRGGCDCAGTYGHYLLHIGKDISKKITDTIDKGDFSTKPGWIRISIHPIMTNTEIEYIADAIKELAINFKVWQKEYFYNSYTNTFIHVSGKKIEELMINRWFNALDLKKK